MPFRLVAGHARIVALLARAIANDTLLPSMLFAGPVGVGKRTIARAIGMAFNCLNPQATEGGGRDACGACAACRRIARGVHPDVITIEPGDTGTIKVEVVREVIERTAYRPFEGRRRLVIVDDADALGESAQNALLKTLEEPPPASSFILVSSRPDALLVTVRSRCPRVRFGPIPAGELAAALVRDHGYSEVNARAIATDAGGSLARALASESEDLVGARERAQQLLAGAARSPLGQRIDLARAIATSGKKQTPAQERQGLAATLRVAQALLRDVGILTASGDPSLVANADLAPQLERLAREYDADRAARAYDAVDRALAALDRNASPKIVADWLAVEI